MTDTVTTPATTEAAPIVETTESSQDVSRPLNTPKPYDDDIFDSYSEDAEKADTETKPDAAPPKVEAKTEEAPKTDEQADPLKAIEETPVKRQINGKEVEFKVKDAIQAYVKQDEFNRKMDQRITHVSQREQRWQQDQVNFKGKIEKIMGVAQSGDFVTATRALAKLAVGNSGLDPTEFEKKYFEQLDKVRDVYSKMTPQEREAYFAKRALAEANARAKALEEEKTANVETSQLQARVQALQAQHNVPQDEFWSNYKALAENVTGDGKAFKTAQEIQPEDVIKFTQQVRHEQKVIDAGQKVGISDQALLAQVSKITAVDPTLTVDDIVQVIQKSGIATADPAAVENLNRKAGKSNTRFSQQASSTKKENAKSGLDKEDLDFLYRKQPRVFQRPAR